jgi:hypothetical protein
MRYLFGFLCVCALGVMPLVGCSETAGNGGTILCEDDFDCDDENECTKELCDLADGMCAYSNESKSTPCDGDGVCDGAGTCVECNDDEQCNDFNDCTSDTCDSANGTCNDPTPVADGTECAGGTCEAGACALSGTVLPCTEQGIRNAIAAGGDVRYMFDCRGGLTTVVTEAEIVIDNDVILDGEGNLWVDGDEDHRVFSVTEGVTAELHGFTVTRGATTGGTADFPERGGGIFNNGTLTLTNSTVSFNSFGGIANGGDMTMTNSSVSGNTLAGIWNDGMLTVTGGTVSKNFGAGIWNNGPLTVTDSTVSGNFDGGGVQNAEEGRLILTNSTVSGNVGGGIDNDGTMTLTNSTVSGNMGKSGSIGGGIVNTASLTVISSTVANNSGWGDALYIGGCFPDRECMTTVANTLIQGDCLSSDRAEALTSNGYNIESPGNTCGFDQTGDQSGVSAVLLDLQPLANKGGPTQTHAITTDSAAFNAGTCEVDEDQRGVTRPQGPACDVGAFELEQ